MEFENSLGNQNKLAELRTRVEKYLEQAFKTEDCDGDSESSAGEAEAGKDVEAVSKKEKKSKKKESSDDHQDDQEMDEESAEEGSESGDEEMEEEEEGSSDE